MLLATAAHAEPPFVAPFHAYEVPGSIRFVTTADVNDDGHFDVVAAHGDSGLSILWGDGTGRLTSRTDLEVGPRPAHAVAADVNGDSRTDLLVANSGAATLSVLVQADGAFVPTRVDLGAAPLSLAVSDLNHDGRLDLVVALRSTNGTVALLGNGDGTFGTPRSIDAGSGWVALGDVNGDGHADAVIADSGCEPGRVCVSLLLGNGDGTFGPGTGILPELWFPTWTSLEDLNGDGALDVIAIRMQTGWLNWAGETMVALGNGDGTFQPVIRLTTGVYPMWASAFTDWNGDGRLDFFFSTAGSESHDHCDYSSVLIGSGDGSFGNPIRVALPPGIVGASSVDLNADGRDEIVAAQRNWIFVVPGRSDAVPYEYAVGISPAALATGDLDGDGYTDVAAANYISNSVSVLLARGDGTLHPAVDYPAGAGPGSLAVGDLNGDALPDLVVANTLAASVSILLGRGDGTFGKSSEFGSGADATSVAIADLGGDAAADLVVVNQTSDTVSILRGDGSGSFTPAGSFGTPDAPLDVAAGHVDSDGHLDLVVASRGAVTVLFGDGQGGFSNRTDVPIGAGVASVVLEDFDSDGRSDVAVSVPGAVQILYGSGDRSFEPPQAYTTGVGGSSLVSGDMNGDGRADITVGGPNLLCVLLNSGHRSFEGRRILGIGSTEGCWNDHGPHYPTFGPVALGDFDADRRLDIVACNSPFRVSLLFNRLERVTPVTLTDVRARADSRRVLLSWRLQMRGGDDIEAVRVQRGESLHGPFVELTPVALEPRASMSFEDPDVVPGRQYWYNLVLVFRGGQTRIGATLEVVTGSTSSWATALEAAFQPGPGQPVHIRYSVEAPTPVELAVFDVRGRRLGVLDAGFKDRGRHHLAWQPRDDRGLLLGRGLYLVHLRAAGIHQSRKLLLLHP